MTTQGFIGNSMAALCVVSTDQQCVCVLAQSLFSKPFQCHQASSETYTSIDVRLVILRLDAH